MKPELRVLHLEDNRTDAVLIEALLREQGLPCEIERVQTRADFVAALEQGDFDLIFSDFTLPGFDGFSALDLARNKRPDIPFLFVSGTLGEEVAIDTLKRGATDYVLKQRLSRLAPAVRRAIAETEERAATARAEQALIQSEFKYRHLFECLSEAAFLSETGAGRVLDANNQAEVLLGRARAEIIGLGQDQFHPPATFEELRQVMAAAAHNPARVSFEGEVLTRNGQAIPVQISAAPLTLYGRRLLLALYRDLSGGRQIEQELRGLTGELERHLRNRTGELAAVRQELEIFSRFLDQNLRPRLLTMAGCAQQVVTRDAPHLDASTGLALTLIRNGAQQTEQLLDRWLAYTRLLDKPLKHSSLDMTALAQSAFEELIQACPDRVFRFDQAPLPPARGDPEEIRQVFTQLFDNAVKFTRGRNPAVIDVSARADAGYNTYYIRDNGVGFPAADAERLYGLFQRLHPDDQFEGVGLGLALVRRIIQRHHGQVGAEGRPGYGALFCFTLPGPHPAT